MRTHGSLQPQVAPLLACLDQVTDPRNLGAVVRSAAGAGATGGSCLPTARQRSRRPCAARRPGRSSTSRSRSCRTWRATSPRSSARPVVVRRDRRCARRALGGRSHGRGGARLRRRGKGRASTRAQDLRRNDLDPARRRGRVAQRQRRRRSAAVRGAPAAGARAGARRKAEPFSVRLPETDALPVRRPQHLARGGVRGPRARDALASFVALKRSAGRARVRRRRRGASSARSRCGTPGCRHAARGARGRDRTSSGSVSSRRMSRCEGRPGRR